MCNGILVHLLPHQAPHPKPAVHKKRHCTTLKVKTTVVAIEEKPHWRRKVFPIQTPKHTFLLELYW